MGLGARESFLLVLACCAVAGALPAGARGKAQPAPQWALDASKTPTPASAKDAAAVVLLDQYVITVDDQNHAVEREQYAVRILEPEGRKYGHCLAEYDTDEKLHYFRSWTIAADGRQFQAMETDFTDEGEWGDQDMQSSEKIRILNPPGGDPGSVVVCETEGELRPYMSSEEWQIQLPIPVVDESLELDLPPGGHYADSWSRYAAVKPMETGAGQLRWEIKDMPALDLENLYATPPWEALAARMSVKWGDSAVKGADSQWREIGEWMDGLEAHRTDPTPEIAAEAGQLTAGAPDLYTKLARITEYIQNNVRYFIVIHGIGGFQAHYAGEVYRNRYGDCKDKTTLLISMLQAAGVKAYYFHVDSERGVIDPAAPSIVGNHMITAIELPPGTTDPRLMARVTTAEGKNLLFFDPTDEETPVGLIRGELQGAWGNLADGAASQALQMPVLAPASAGLERKGTFVLGADGSLTGTVAATYSGGDAASRRGTLKEADAKEVREGLERSLGDSLPGLTLAGFEYRDRSSIDRPLALEIQLSVPDYAHGAGTLLLVRPRVMGSYARSVPDVMDGKARRYPIELGHPGRWHDSFDIALPAGYTVDETPDPVAIELPFASYSASSSVKGNVLHYEREYMVRQVEIPASQADGFRRLEDMILEDEKGMAVLKKR
ncbi:MAG TPA: DUF3857 domain-containing protein [Terracidiphilus sp.]|nr:DUF3857 domain-containing protein [Terracidiphilus sp.]